MKFHKCLGKHGHHGPHRHHGPHGHHGPHKRHGHHGRPHHKFHGDHEEFFHQEGRCHSKSPERQNKSPDCQFRGRRQCSQDNQRFEKHGYKGHHKGHGRLQSMVEEIVRNVLKANGQLNITSENEGSSVCPPTPRVEQVSIDSEETTLNP